MDRIGLAQACVEAGAPFLGWNICDAAGNVLMATPAPNEAAPHLPPLNGITRPALHRILTGGADEAGVSLRMGLTLEAWQDHGDHVDVTFTDGTAGRYALVVGADGIYSALRRKLFGDALQPRFLGEGLWRYNLPRPADMDRGGIYFGPRSKAGLVPLSDTIMYMFLVTPEPDDRRYDGPDLAEQMQARLDGHGGLVGELRALITDPREVVYRPAHTIMLPEPWHRGRFVLIGDAVHAAPPHLAQGAAMAVEDAVLLARLVAQPGPLPDLLAEFMQRRFHRAKLVSDISTQTARWETEEWAGRPDPAADPGGLLHSATAQLMQDF